MAFNRHQRTARDRDRRRRSTLGEDRWSFERTVLDLLDLLGLAGEEASHLIGISESGMIAQSFELVRPQRVASLSLTGMNLGSPPEARGGMRDSARRVRERRNGRILQSFRGPPLLERSKGSEP